MSKPTRGNKRQPPGRSIDIASRTLEEHQEALRRREEWATQRALREQLERLVRDKKDER